MERISVECKSKLRIYVRKVLILIGSCVLYYITIGMTQSFGIIYSELLDQFHGGRGETSWISSLSTGLLLVLGPVAGILEQRYGCRKVAITGSIIIAVGMFCSGFVTSLHFLYLTYGIICGVGYGLCLLVANAVVPLHFTKRLSLATAISTAGGRIGTITMPMVVRIWLKEYGWRGTFTLMAGVGLQGVVFSAFLETPKNKVSQEKQYLKAKVRMICTNKRYWIYLVSSIFASLGYFTIYVILPDAAKQRGQTADDAAFLITVSGISGLIGRIFVALLADRQEFDRCAINGVFLALGGLATIGCRYVYSYSVFLAYSIFLGIFVGTFAFLQGVIIVDIVGKDYFTMAFGFVSLSEGIAVTVGIPIAGWLADSTGSYNEAFYYVGLVFLIGGILSIIIPIYSRYKKRNVIDLTQTIEMKVICTDKINPISYTCTSNRVNDYM